jgi:hypothetical protein
VGIGEGGLLRGEGELMRTLVVAALFLADFLLLERLVLGEPSEDELLVLTTLSVLALFVFLLPTECILLLLLLFPLWSLLMTAWTASLWLVVGEDTLPLLLLSLIVSLLVKVL